MICLLCDGKLYRDVQLCMLGTAQDTMQVALERGVAWLAEELAVPRDQVGVQVRLGRGGEIMPRWRVPDGLAERDVRQAINRTSYRVDTFWRSHRRELLQRRA